MAEATGLRNTALPYPVYGSPFALEFPIRYSYGGFVTGAAGLDSERSLNGDTFADCTNEATEIATTSGNYYLLLTAAEMTADVVKVIVKTSTTDAVPPAFTLYPRKLVTIRSGTSASGGSATSTIILDSGASAEDDFYNGMLVIATIDGNVESRVISDYTGSSKTATVVPDWNVAPDSDDTFVIKLPDGWQVHQSNVTMLGGSSQSATDLKDFADTGYDPSTHKVAGVVLVDTTTTNSDMRGTDSANTTTPPSASAIADEVQTRTIAAVTNVAGLGANALTDTAIATAAANKIRDAVWNALLNAYNSLGTMGYHIVELFSDAASLESRLTSTRAGYLDNLNISGNVASSAEVTAVQNNTRVVRVVPTVIERPDSGTTTYRIELLAYDNVGNMEAPDSAPTLDLVNQAGDDLTSRLDSTTGTLVSTGRYRWVYTNSNTDDLEQLVWAFSVVEGGNTRLYGNTSLIVDTTAVDFTSADRTKLEAIHTKLPSKSYLTGTANSDGDIEANEATGNFPGSVASVAGAVGSVTGDVGGKVLGGGSGTITGTGARVVDASGNNVATAASQTAIETDTQDIQSRLPAALVSGRMDASVGEMQNDVITAAAHDESTAFPVASADAGSTALARTGADGDTLETLSDEIAGVSAGGASAEDVRVEMDANSTKLALITEARMGALTDLIDGGRLDLLIDAILADTSTDGVALSAAVCNKVADHVRRRTQANVEASSDGDAPSLGSEYGFIQQAQESAVSGGTMTVYKTDGTTPLGTKTLTTDADAEPITGVS